MTIEKPKSKFPWAEKFQLNVLNDPEETKAPTHELRFNIPDGISDEDAREYVAGILRKINEAHRQMGGQGIKIFDAGTSVPAKTLAMA
ncbi:hypothetical protein GCM10007047_18090 [Cerasicoccus arenae]|uniref:Uncharacterized protein n=2 Tax=Cerasicoccus arenae TaxID=424488 RepID=A0A8J3DJX8_9BACT|nr:hypothetical protein GCM10007047_18090 [Cerasicoccus arenae]